MTTQTAKNPSLRRRGRIPVSHLIIQLVLILVLAIWVFPLTIMVRRSLIGLGFQNYVTVITDADFFMFLRNSVLVAALDIFFIVATVTPAAFAFSKMDFRGRGVLYIMTLLGMMMPAAGFIVPYFIMLKNLGLMNQFGLVGPHVVGSIPMSMMIIRNSFDEIEDEMIEAAVIDGCTRFSVFTQMMLPLGRNAIATSVIFAFLASWNDYLMPLVLLQKPEYMTITLLPDRYKGFGGGDNVGIIFAALTLISVPIFIVYITCQRFLQKGISAGTIK